MPRKNLPPPDMQAWPEILAYLYQLHWLTCAAEKVEQAPRNAWLERVSEGRFGPRQERHKWFDGENDYFMEHHRDETPTSRMRSIGKDIVKMMEKELDHAGMKIEDSPVATFEKEIACLRGGWYRNARRPGEPKGQKGKDKSKASKGSLTLTHNANHAATEAGFGGNMGQSTPSRFKKGPFGRLIPINDNVDPGATVSTVGSDTSATAKKINRGPLGQPVPVVEVDGAVRISSNGRDSSGRWVSTKVKKGPFGRPLLQ